MVNGGVTLSDIQIQWNAAFCAAAELELLENREELDFQREHNLSKKPLQIDLLVVEKRTVLRKRIRCSCCRDG